MDGGWFIGNIGLTLEWIHFSDPAMLRKVVFMFNSLMIDNAKFGEALLKTDIWEYLNNVLDKYPEDEDMAEKVNRERESGHLGTHRI